MIHCGWHVLRLLDKFKCDAWGEASLFCRLKAVLVDGWMASVGDGKHVNYFRIKFVLFAVPVWCDEGLGML